MTNSIPLLPPVRNPQSIGLVSQRVVARIILQRAFLEALEADPTLVLSPMFVEHAKANAYALSGEYRA